MIQAAALSGCLVPGLDREFPLFIQDLENPGNGEKFKKNLDISLPLLYNIIVVQNNYSSIAQSVEHAAVNRAVVGSSPTRGAFYYCPVLPGLNRLTEAVRYDSINKQYGPMVKRLRHRPFTAVTRVRISLGSLLEYLVFQCIQ